MTPTRFMIVVARWGLTASYLVPPSRYPRRAWLTPGPLTGVPAGHASSDQRRMEDAVDTCYMNVLRYVEWGAARHAGQ